MSGNRHSDDRLAEFAVRIGKATQEQIQDARGLVEKMRTLGVKRDVLGALVDRELLSRDEADAIRTLAASAAGGGLGGASGAAPAPPLPAGPTPLIGEIPSVEAAGPTEGADGEADFSGEIRFADETDVAEPVRLADRPEAIAAPPEAPPPGLQATRCHLHPERPAFVSCSRCGKRICGECSVRTQLGVFCGQECVFAASQAEKARLGAPAPMARSARPIIIVGGTLLVTFLIWILLLPSSELKKARSLKGRSIALEEAGRLTDALEAAVELRAMKSGESEIRQLAEWGGKRAEKLKERIGLARLTTLRKAIDASDHRTVLARRDEIEALAEEFADVPRLRREIDSVRRMVEICAVQARKAGEQAEREAAAERAREAVSKLRGEIEPLAKGGRHGDALVAVARARADAGRDAHPAFVAGLDSIDREIVTSARAAYEAEDRKAKGLVLAFRFVEARAVYARVIERCGIDAIAAEARAGLKAVDEAALAAAESIERGKVDKARAAVARAEELMGSFKCFEAIEVLRGADRMLKRGPDKDRISYALATAERDYMVMGRIIDRINVRPVTLSVAGPGRTGSQKKVFHEASEAGYSIRIAASRGGSVVVEGVWADLSVDEICRLARLAAGDDEMAKADTELFCQRHGGE